MIIQELSSLVDYVLFPNDYVLSQSGAFDDYVLVQVRLCSFFRKPQLLAIDINSARILSLNDNPTSQFTVTKFSIFYPFPVFLKSKFVHLGV